MNPLALPQARIPMGWAMVGGQRVPVEIAPEWMRALDGLLDRSGGISGSTNFSQYINQFFDAPPMDAGAQEALRAVDELRHELAFARGSVDVLRALVDDQAQALAELRAVGDLRNRLEQLEDRLA